MNIDNYEKFVMKQTLDGVVVSCSENIQKFLGYDPNCLQHTSIYTLIHPDDLPDLLQVHLKLIDQGPVAPLMCKYRMMRKDGSYSHVYSTFILEAIEKGPWDQGSDYNFRIVCMTVDLSNYSSRPTYAPETSSYNYMNDDISSMFAANSNLFSDNLAAATQEISSEELRNQIENLKRSINQTSQLINVLQSEIEKEKEKSSYDSLKLFSVDEGMSQNSDDLSSSSSLSPSPQNITFSDSDSNSELKTQNMSSSSSTSFPNLIIPSASASTSTSTFNSSSVSTKISSPSKPLNNANNLSSDQLQPTTSLVQQPKPQPQSQPQPVSSTAESSTSPNPPNPTPHRKGGRAPKDGVSVKRERRVRKPPIGDRCGECQIEMSSEWRKGPDPDKLLCNACGLRYTRKLKKEKRLSQKDLSKI